MKEININNVSNNNGFIIEYILKDYFDLESNNSIFYYFNKNGFKDIEDNQFKEEGTENN